MKIGFSILARKIESSKHVIDEMIGIGFNHIEVGIDDIEEWKYIKRLKVKRKDISIGIHMPMEMNPSESIECIRRSWASFFEEIIRRGNEINIAYYNLHMGYGIKKRLLNNRENYLQKQVCFFEGLVNKVDCGFISLENTYFESGEMVRLGYQESDFDYVFNRNDKLEFCYDTGHSLISGGRWNGNCKDRMKIAHLSNNDGISDCHWGINKKGKFNLDDLIGISKNKGLEFIICEMAEQDLKASFKIIKDKLKI